MIFLFQDPPIIHTPSIDIDLGTLPHIHGEPKPHTGLEN